MALRFGVDCRLQSDHLESDLSDFIILKNRHEKTTGVPLDNDLLITLIMQKTTGPFLQHLRLHVRNISTFTEALEIVYSYIKSRLWLCQAGMTVLLTWILEH